MNKVLLLIDPRNFRPSVLQFVNSIVAHPSKVVGVFLADPTYTALPGLKSIGGQVYVEEITIPQEIREQQHEALHKAKGAFKCNCLEMGISFDTCEDVPMSLRELVRESRYADLIVADYHLSATGGDDVPSALLRDLLHHAECPVLIAPETDLPVDKVVFSYDGSKSSMFAIRQFYHYLPHLRSLPLKVFNMDDDKKKITDREVHLLDQWLALNINHYSFEYLSGSAENGLFSYFLANTGQSYSLLVAGAFGRNAISNFLKAPTLELSVKALDIPVFITHL